jgi:hypothetical protein
MKIITYATHSHGFFDELIKKNPEIIVLGLGTPWKGFVYRIQVILDYINNLPDDEIIVIVDGFDTIIKKTEGLEDKFKSKDCGVLYSIDDNWGLSNIIPSFINKYFVKKVYGTCKDNLTLNAGLSMGYVKYIKEVYNKILIGDSSDDQRNLNKACNSLPFLKIDKDHEIFQNCSSLEQVEKSTAFICAIPGEMSFDRYLRGMLEYSKYFIPEIIIFILIIILIILKIKKKI